IKDFSTSNDFYLGYENSDGTQGNAIRYCQANPTSRENNGDDNRERNQSGSSCGGTNLAGQAFLIDAPYEEPPNVLDPGLQVTYTVPDAEHPALNTTLSAIDNTLGTASSALSCSALGGGWVNNVSGVCGESEPCRGQVTYNQAVAECASRGARLCTLNELGADATAGSGCGYDAERVWTQSLCNTSSYWTQAGSSGSLGSRPLQCTQSIQRAYVRCCADTSTAPPPSDMTWTIVSGPAGLSLNPTGAQTNLTWPNPTPGLHNVTVRATDGNGNSDTTTFSIKVLDNRPDDFLTGYRWARNSTASNWDDISSTGSRIATWQAGFGSNHDGFAVVGTSTEIDLPDGFVFMYYNQPQTRFRICANGAIAFGNQPCWSARTNTSDGRSAWELHTIDEVRRQNKTDNLIYGFWSDLRPDLGGNVYHQVKGSPGSRQLIVQFDNVPVVQVGDGTVRFQMVLFEGSNAIEIRVDNIEIPSNYPYFIGLEDVDSCAERTGDRGAGSWPIRGSACGESDVVLNSTGGLACSGSVTYAQAQALCASAGARLCSIGELSADVPAGTGCGYDATRVWSSSDCNGGVGAQTQAGASGNLGLHPNTCTNKAATATVRCCADVNSDDHGLLADFGVQGTNTSLRNMRWTFTAPAMTSPQSPSLEPFPDQYVAVGQPFSKTMRSTDPLGLGLAWSLTQGPGGSAVTLAESTPDTSATVAWSSPQQTDSDTAFVMTTQVASNTGTDTENWTLYVESKGPDGQNYTWSEIAPGFADIASEPSAAEINVFTNGYFGPIPLGFQFCGWKVSTPSSQTYTSVWL
ncbi:MAG: Ig domain-containing protein, partial [Myxococcota bacterium]